MNDLIASIGLNEIDMDIMGLSNDDLQIYGVEFDLKSIASSSVDEIIKASEELKEANKPDKSSPEYLEKKQAVKDIKAATFAKNETDTYVTLTFSTQEAKQAFMEKINEPPDSLYIKGEMFQQKYFNDAG